ncbi:MAG: (Fe-S)-binding protein [Desulfitobacteriaceae bacterium]
MLDRENLLAEAKKCIRCGLCQAVCPSYRVVRNEPAVARGRNWLVRQLVEGQLTMSPRLKDEMFACLGCEACQTNCPAGVRTPEIVAQLRSEYVAKDGLPFTQLAILRGMLPHPKRLALAAKTFRLGQKMKAVAAVAKGFPESLKGRLEVLPEVLPEPLQEKLKPGFPEEAKVAYFLSCTTNFLTPNLGWDTLEVLKQSGYQAAICTDTLCCGKPQNSLGDQDTALKMAVHNVQILSKLPVEAIVTDCATCGSALKEYPRWLKGHVLEEEARQVAAKVYDISEFLVKKGFKVGDYSQKLTVTYHDPCHLNHAQGVRQEPREILKSLPGVTFVESPDADRCCGGAGSFCLTHPQVSERILEPKVESILSTKADRVATGCPMCKIQLQYGLRNTDVKSSHPVELLARTFKAEPKD